MEQKRVSILVAKLAKEKGFDEWCNCYYLLAKQDIYNTLGTSIEYKKGEHIRINEKHKNSICDDKNNEFWDEYSAPEQSFLSDWLRIKYHIDIRVAINSLTCYFPMIQLIDVDGTQMKGPTYKNHGSYGKAFDYGLYEALQLIKIPEETIIN